MAESKPRSSRQTEKKTVRAAERLVGERGPRQKTGEAKKREIELKAFERARFVGEITYAVSFAEWKLRQKNKRTKVGSLETELPVGFLDTPEEEGILPRSKKEIAALWNDALEAEGVPLDLRADLIATFRAETQIALRKGSNPDVSVRSPARPAYAKLVGELSDDQKIGRREKERTKKARYRKRLKGQSVDPT